MSFIFIHWMKADRWIGPSDLGSLSLAWRSWRDLQIAFRPVEMSVIRASPKTTAGAIEAVLLSSCINGIEELQPSAVITVWRSWISAKINQEFDIKFVIEMIVTFV